jgi:phosphoribosylanthranilate isomerase
MKVKICGIKDIDTALFAANCGADALGFVFYEPSPRNISVQKAKEICDKLPPFVTKVGLFVNTSAEVVNKTCNTIGLDLAQIHFEATKEFYDSLNIRHIKVIRAKNIQDLSIYSDEYRIVDSFIEGFGGGGIELNLEWFKGVDTSKIILAGGLNCKNIENATRLGFYGVDVSSGVESSRGMKDYTLIKNFIKNANH